MTKESKINELIAEELKAMCKKHNQEKFNSEHEAYAVTLEEVEEVTECIDVVKDELPNLWNGVRNDCKDLSCNYENMRKYALGAIQELIQVCACCDKAVRK